MIRDFVNSLYQYRYYPNFLKRKKGRIFLYALLLIFLNFAVTVLMPLTVLEIKFGGVEGAIRTYVPEFSLSGGKLSLEEPIHYADGSVYIDINTDPSYTVDTDSKEFRTQEALNDVVIAGDADHIVIRAAAGNSLTARRTDTIRFSDFGNLSISKEDLYSYVPWIRSVIAAGCAFLFLMKLLSFFFWALVITMFATIFVRRNVRYLPFGKFYGLSVYSRTLPVVVETILSAFGMLFMEAVLIGIAYSVFLLSRASRVISAEAESDGGGLEQFRSPQEFRNPQEYRNRWGGNSEGGSGSEDGTGIGREDVSGRDSAPEDVRGTSAPDQPTPKTPDDGTGMWYGTAPESRTGTKSVEEEKELESQSPENQSPEDQSPEDQSPEESPEEPQSGRIERGAPEKPREEKEKKPDLILPKATYHADIHPSDGFSFGKDSAPEDSGDGKDNAPEDSGDGQNKET